MICDSNNSLYVNMNSGTEALILCIYIHGLIMSFYNDKQYLVCLEIQSVFPDAALDQCVKLGFLLEV